MVSVADAPACTVRLPELDSEKPKDGGACAGGGAGAGTGAGTGAAATVVTVITAEVPTFPAAS